MPPQKNRKFAKKHGNNVNLNAAVKDEITKSMKNGAIFCDDAFRIADKLNITSEKVGITADLMDCKLTGCQLGLFGLQSQNKASEMLLPELKKNDLKKKIMSELIDSRLTCKKAWEIASQHRVCKITVTELCDEMKIKITRCQLGAF